MRSSLAKYLELLSLVRGHKLLMFVAILASACAGFLDALLISFLKDVIERGFLQQNERFLAYFPLYIMLYFIVRSIAGYGADFLPMRMGRLVTLDLRLQLAKQLLQLPKVFFERESMGKIQTSFGYRVDQVAAGVTTSLCAYVRESLLILLLVIIMFSQSWQLALMATLSMPMILWVYRLTAAKLRRTNALVQDQVADLAQLSGQVFSSVADINAYQQSAFFLERFQGVYRRNYHSELASGHYTAFLSASLYVVTGVPFALMMYWVWFDQAIPSVGSITVLLAAMLRILHPLKLISQYTAEVQKALVSWLELRRYLYDSMPLKKRAMAPQLLLSADNLGYQNSYQETVLQNVSFSVQAHERIAIVGPSGSGKSTLVQLIAGVLQPTSGYCSIGRDLAYVRQEPWVFNGSVRENIVFGESDCEERLWELLTRVDLARIINELPQGVDTTLGQGFKLLSGGEMQRLAIARALWRAPDWLLLDEVTSALDQSSEKKIVDLLNRLNVGLLFVTHRLHYLEQFDRVLFIAKGCLVHFAPYHEMMASCAEFSQFVKQQDQEELP